MCRKMRKDEDIKVLTYQLTDFLPAKAERNLKYCADDVKCYSEALLKAKTGKM